MNIKVDLSKILQTYEKVKKSGIKKTFKSGGIEDFDWQKVDNIDVSLNSISPNASLKFVKNTTSNAWEINIFHVNKDGLSGGNLEMHVSDLIEYSIYHILKNTDTQFISNIRYHNVCNTQFIEAYDKQKLFGDKKSDLENLTETMQGTSLIKLINRVLKNLAKTKCSPTSAHRTLSVSRRVACENHTS